MLKVPLNDLSRISEKDINRFKDSVHKILQSGIYLKGSFTNELELQLSNMFEGRTVVAVGNGTDALTIAISALDLPENSLIATCPNAGGYAGIAARQAGHRTVLVDIDLETAQMSSESLVEVIDSVPNIKAVIVTHLYGLCGDVTKIAETCIEKNILLIEDCAQSFGAYVNSRPAGVFGDLAILSFYPTKNLGGIGDGGAIVCKSLDLAKRVAQISQYGWGNKYQIQFQDGMNSRIDEIQAAFLLIQLEKVSSQNATRRGIIQSYISNVSGNRRIISAPNETFVGHLAVMVLPDRNKDRLNLESNGVQTGIHYPFLDSEQPAWFLESAGGYTPELKNAIKLNSQILTIPCFPTMTSAEIQQVSSALQVLE
jgi:dTDP-4-amino-4,6-dideoxygalactose transaminase